MKRDVVLPFVVLGMVAAAGCTGAAPSTEVAAVASARTKVETVTATVRAVPRTMRLTGSLAANAHSDVAANATGRVARVFVERGSAVTEGTPLVQLDTRQITLVAAEARAGLQASRTQKGQADSECERTERLFERHVITKQEYERTSASCRVASTSVAAAEARLHQAALTESDATVRAPFDGVVVARHVEVGEYVRPDTTIAELVQVDPMRLEASIGEADSASIREGQTLNFEVKALPGRTFTATVHYVSPALRAATRDLVFEAVVPNPDGALKPGMFATAALDVGTEERVVLPRTALRVDGTDARAFVVQGDHLEERLVQCSREAGDEIVILRGVAAGERVVARDVDGLRDGLPVE